VSDRVPFYRHDKTSVSIEASAFIRFDIKGFGLSSWARLERPTACNTSTR
jgi:hypothetical protein